MNGSFLSVFLIWTIWGIGFAIPQHSNSKTNVSKPVVSVKSPPPSISTQLLGKWDYYKYIYKGTIQFPRDQDTHLYYEFIEGGRSVLLWKNDAERMYCERRGLFYNTDKSIVDEVVWVHPSNSRECGQDPDMRVGRTTVTPFRIVEDELHLDLPLGDDFLTYVFKRMPPSEPVPTH
jgi:hypothetical protein